MHAVFSLLPLVAAILAVPQFLPQLARLARTGQTAGVSWSWAALTSINNAAWAGYFALSGFRTALVPAISATVLAGTLAVSPVRRRRASWGRNCGTARIAATSGSKLNTACIDDPSVARMEAPRSDSLWP